MIYCIIWVLPMIVIYNSKVLNIDRYYKTNILLDMILLSDIAEFFGVTSSQRDLVCEEILNIPSFCIILFDFMQHHTQQLLKP